MLGDISYDEATQKSEGKYSIHSLISFHFISFHFSSFHFISFHFVLFHFITDRGKTGAECAGPWRPRCFDPKTSVKT